MKPVLLAPVARNDLKALHTYIARDNPAAADHQLRRLQGALRHLSEFPGAGHERPDLTPLPVRFWPVGNYLVIYRQKPHAVEVVRVLSRFRDVGTALTP